MTEGLVCLIVPNNLRRGTSCFSWRWCDGSFGIVTMGCLSHKSVCTVGNATSHSSLYRHIVRCNASLAVRCIAQHVRLEAVVDTACRLVQGDLLESRGSVGDRLDQTWCCRVHVQRCHGDIRELRRLLNQIEEAGMDKSVHVDALFVRRRWRGRQ